MILRNLERKVKYLYTKFPILSLTGPRQSGKTTLLRHAFSHLPYASLEDPDQRRLALADPRGFLNSFPEGAILDEVQNAPELFSYLQTFVDNNKKLKFIISGSQNFLLMRQITQSLAGRVAILRLLPLSIQELKGTEDLGANFEPIAFRGFYPRIIDQEISPGDFYPSYLDTYIERDVRQLTNVGNIVTFGRFMRLCAGRAGQMLNMSALASDTGISVNTVKSWLSILETSYVLFRLQPHHKNFKKRQVRMPKLYFHDTGLLCYLLGIRSAEQLKTHYARGPIFENMVISEIAKNHYNRGKNPDIFFWRDSKGKEVDLIVERGGGERLALELKSGETMSLSFFDGLNYWNQLSNNPSEHSYVVYGGERNLNTRNGSLLGWKALDQINLDN